MGELACKERQRRSGQFVEGAGSARAMGAGRSEATPAPIGESAASIPLPRDFGAERKQIGPPEGSPFALKL